MGNHLLRVTQSLVVAVGLAGCQETSIAPQDSADGLVSLAPAMNPAVSGTARGATGQGEQSLLTSLVPTGAVEPGESRRSLIS